MVVVGQRRRPGRDPADPQRDPADQRPAHSTHTQHRLSFALVKLATPIPSTSADLSDTSLLCADLSGADLSKADLSHADLGAANLAGANLDDANLTGADLSCTRMDESDG